MRKQLHLATFGICVAGILLFSGCVAYGPGPDGYYNYDYYPDWDVYYYPDGGLYYWNVDSHWHSGRRLPSRYQLSENSRQHLQMHTRQPWNEPHPAFAAHGVGGGHPGGGHDSK